MRDAGRVVILVIGTAVALGWCALLGLVVGGDPMLLVEVGVAVVLILWSAMIVRDVWVARSLAHAFTRASTSRTIAGVRCRLVRDPSLQAVVVGALSPKIYIGLDFLNSLDPDEIRGVLLHEEHHRRTRAPLRAAALEAWLRMARRIGVIERILTERIADLEVSADAFAMAAGAGADALASALLKGRPGTVAGTGFADASEVRITALLEAERGESRHQRRLPLEWLPVATVGVAVAACHVGLLLGPG